MIVKLLLGLGWWLVTAIWPTGVEATEVKTVAIRPTADAYADQKMPEAKTGDWETMYASYDLAGRKQLGVLLNFDLSVVPKGATVNSAKLKLYQQVAFGEDENTELSMYIIADPWEEKTLKWTNKPTFFVPDACRILGYEVDKSEGYKEWEIKCLVDHWRLGYNPYYGFYILPPLNQQWMSMFYSKEKAGKEPLLTITYTIAGPSMTPTPTPTSTPTLTPTPTPTATPPVAETVTPTPAVVAPVKADGEVVEPKQGEKKLNLEKELAQVLTAKNLKTVGIILLAALAIKILLK